MPRKGAPSIQNAGQYPAAASPVTFGICRRASTRSLPPAGGWKSVRVVSIRPEVQLPDASRRGVMSRSPLPSRETLLVLDVIDSTSPVPQLPAPPGYEVPVSNCQLEVLTLLPAAPSKSSRNTCDQPEGGAGAEASAGPVAAVATAAARPNVATAAMRARRTERERGREWERGLGVPEESLMGGLSGAGSGERGTRDL
ncbi:protein of unknown function [Streptomyces murinus]